MEDRQLLSSAHPLAVRYHHGNHSVEIIVIKNETFVHEGGTLVPVTIKLTAEDDHTSADGAEIDNTRGLNITSQLPANQVASLILQLEKEAMSGI
jgi:hypothetical protein